MFYDHTYTIVTVHSMKDCLDQPLHRSYVISSMTLFLPSELGNESRVKDPKKKAYSWWIRLDASPTNILQHILNNRCSDYMRFFGFGSI